MAGNVCVRGRIRNHGGHGAVMNALATAAGRKASLITAWQQRREGRQPAQCDQPNGESTPHLTMMVHEVGFAKHCSGSGSKVGAQTHAEVNGGRVRYHRGIAPSN